MNTHNPTDMSVIVPVYNIEDYLPGCIESLIHQDGLRLEFVLVNDGSTDSSGTIADQYAQQDSRIRVIHRENGGASAARNTGLDLAQGEYIAFFDGDDWVKEGSLLELYREAVRHQADVVMGNVRLCHQDGSMDQLFLRITNEILHKEIPKNVLPGKDGFVWMVKSFLYLPMPFKYIYRRKYLQEIQARFEEGIMHEDELWSPVVLYHAEKMVITGIEFYYYRQNQASVMHTTNLIRRLDSLFRVTDRLIEFADRAGFSKESGELTDWWHVNVFRLYTKALTLLPNVKDSSHRLPEHHLDRYWRDCRQMTPEAQQRCRDYYRHSAAGLKKYIDWRISDWVASIDCHIRAGKKLMLVYNALSGQNLSIQLEEVPTDWVITTDRRYLYQAVAVVFHLPDLSRELEQDLEKLEGQIWISWYLDSEKDNPLLHDPEIRDTFDLWMNYCQYEKLEEHPLVYLCRQVEEKMSGKISD
jgi:glycosyltransferase involved in cell wall biosynthesis